MPSAPCFLGQGYAFRGVGIAPDADLLGLVGPAEEFGKFGGGLGLKEGKSALVDAAAGAVNGDHVALAYNSTSDAEGLVFKIYGNFFCATDTGFAHCPG